MSLKKYVDIFKGIVTGKIVNEETGEISDTCHYIFDTGFKMETIIQINSIENYTHPDNSWQILVEGLGLDSSGSIFALCLNFTPMHNNEAVKILNDLKSSSFLYVQGPYSIIYSDKVTTIHDPIYSPLPEDFQESEVNKVFMINSGKIKDINN